MKQSDILELLNKIDELLIRNVQREMQRKGWNQSELGRRMGRDPNRVSRFLTKGSWDSDLLARAADAFGVRAWELLQDEESAISPERALEELARHMGFKIQKAEKK